MTAKPLKKGATYDDLVRERHHGDARIRAQPFAAVELDLQALWI